jgi:hypothetical protein
MLIRLEESRELADVPVRLAALGAVRHAPAARRRRVPRHAPPAPRHAPVDALAARLQDRRRTRRPRPRPRVRRRPTIGRCRPSVPAIDLGLYFGKVPLLHALGWC